MKLPKFNTKAWKGSFRTRSFRVGGYSVLVAAIVLAIAIAANLLAQALPSAWTQLDMTSNALYTLSEQTESILSALDQEVTVYWIVRDSYADVTIGTLLDRYQDLSGQVKVQKKDPDVYPAFVQQYTDSAVDNSLVVTCGDRYRYIDYNDIYVLDYESYYYYGTEDWSFCGESELTSAIDYVTSQELPRIYTLTGHGESSLSDTFSSAVGYENMELEELSLLTLEQVPEDADCILIYAPKTDIAVEEKTMLQAYLASGGSLLLITDPPENGALTNLESLMADYGVTAAEGVVIEGDQNRYAWGRPYHLLPEYGSHAITDPLESGGYYVLLPIAQGLTVGDSGDDSITVQTLLSTSDSAFSKLAGYSMTTYELEEGDIQGPFALAVAIDQVLDSGEQSKLVWVSSAALLDDDTNTQVSGGNQDFFLNALNYLCGSEESAISIHAKSLSMEYLTMDSTSSSMLTTLVIAVIPLAYLAIGLVTWFRRRRR